MRQRQPYGLVALVLAVGMAVAINVMTLAALYVALRPNPTGIPPRLGDHATQVLLSWGGGIIGVLGAYVGYAIGKKTGDDE